MAYKFIHYLKDNGIARIIINRQETMNALNPETLTEIKKAVDESGTDAGVGVIVLTGAGRAFSTGVDLVSVGDRKLERGRVGEILDNPARELINSIQHVPKVVIAMVNGFCLTGALEIALACDLIIASESARFGDTHVRWAFRPSWGMSARLPRAIGLAKAKELSFTADMISARDAERLGLINMAVPAEKLEETVTELSRKIMANSLQAVAAYKYLYNNGIKETLGGALQLEEKSEFDITDTDERVRSFRKKA